MNLDRLYSGLVLTLVIIFLMTLYNSWKKDRQEVDLVYKKSYEQLQKDVLIHGISHRHFHNELRNNMQNIINTENKSSRFSKILNSCYSGVIRGGFIGLIGGGPSEAIANSIVFGLVSPIILYVKDTYLFKEALPT